MFVILSYDVGQARVGKVSKIAKKYLCPVQRSLFEGFLTESHLTMLKNELRDRIDPETDSVLFYKLSGSSCFSVDELGVQKADHCGIL